jgi:hypothetical protein
MDRPALVLFVGMKIVPVSPLTRLAFAFQRGMN